MNRTSDFFISASNTGGGADYLPNASGVNLPATQASVFDLNRIMSPLTENLKKPAPPTDSGEALFGTHIKEGIEIVRNWVRDSKK